MRTLLNIIWFVFSGFWLWLAYMLAGIICCLLIITIPWGIASFRMASYAVVAVRPGVGRQAKLQGSSPSSAMSSG